DLHVTGVQACALPISAAVTWRIRPFEATDRDAVVRLWQRCGLTRPWNDPGRDIDRKLTVQRELFVVGEGDGVVVASGMAGFDGHRGRLNYLAVDPDHRGRRHRRPLVEHGERALEALGRPEVNLQVRTGNAEALAFYAALGYGTRRRRQPRQAPGRGLSACSSPRWARGAGATPAARSARGRRRTPRRRRGRRGGRSR